MRISMITKLSTLLTLTLIVGVFLFAGTITAYADADPITDKLLPMETLSVDEVWLTGDTLHITVTDKNSGESQSFELNLSDYAKAGDEYVTVQATDNSGNTSNSIQFKNPYYVPRPDSDSIGNDGIDNDDGNSNDDGNGKDDDSLPLESNVSESAIPGADNPFTPDGTGTVMDTATDGDGKEFFTVETPDGNVFYLIVDRQRSTDNVYLLNAVTEDDLASLAKPSDGKNVSTVELPPVVAPATTPETTPEPEPTAPPAPAQNGGNNTGTIIFIMIAVIGVGGAGYYFKIVRPKKLGANDDDDYSEEPDGFDDEEMDVDDDKEDENR